MPAGLWARDAAVGALHLFQPTRRTGTRTIRLPLHRVPDPFSPRRALGPGRLVVLFSLLPLHPRTQTRARTPSRTRDHPRVRSASRAPSTRNLPHPETLLPSVSPCVPTLSLPPHPPRPPPTRLLSSRSLLTNTFLQPHESANPPPPPTKPPQAQTLTHRPATHLDSRLFHLPETTYLFTLAVSSFRQARFAQP